MFSAGEYLLEEIGTQIVEGVRFHAGRLSPSEHAHLYRQHVRGGAALRSWVDDDGDVWLDVLFDWGAMPPRLPRPEGNTP